MRFTQFVSVQIPWQPETSSNKQILEESQAQLTSPWGLFNFSDIYPFEVENVAISLQSFQELCGYKPLLPTKWQEGYGNNQYKD